MTTTETAVAPEARLWSYVGKAVYVETVTKFYTGRVVDVSPEFIALKDAAWIADTGRYTDALDSGEFNEVEPIPVGTVLVGIGAIVSVLEWAHALPREQK